MFGNIGLTELMIILVIVLVLFGAKRIPEIGASFGKGIREFKKNVNEVERSIARAGADAPRTRRLAAGEPRAVGDTRERGSAPGAQAPHLSSGETRRGPSGAAPDGPLSRLVWRFERQVTDWRRARAVISFRRSSIFADLRRSA